MFCMKKKWGMYYSPNNIFEALMCLQYNCMIHTHVRRIDQKLAQMGEGEDIPGSDFGVRFFWVELYFCSLWWCLHRIFVVAPFSATRTMRWTFLQNCARLLSILNSDLVIRMKLCWSSCPIMKVMVLFLSVFYFVISHTDCREILHCGRQLCWNNWNVVWIF